MASGSAGQASTQFHHADASAPTPVLPWLEGACAGVIAFTGLAGGFILAMGETDAARSLHLRGGDAVVFLAILLPVAGYASGLHRRDGWRWRLDCLFAFGAPAIYVAGDVAVHDPSGIVGRAHAADVLGGVALTTGLARSMHVVAGVLLVLVLVALAWRARRERGERRPAAAGAVAGASVVLVAAWVLPAPPKLPTSLGAAAAVPPWPALALVPPEEVMPLGLLLALVVLGVAFLMLLPRIDTLARPPWVRRAMSLALIVALASFLLLLAAGSFVYERFHVHTLGEGSP